MTFLHGWLGGGDDWREVTRLLDSGYGLLLIDLPGHRGSTAVGHYYDMQETCSAVLEIVQSHTTAKSVLIGYSMGGRIALGCALKSPRLFGGLILEGTNPGIEAAGERHNRAEHDNQLAQQLEEIGLREFLPQWYGMELFESLRADQARYQKLIGKRAAGNALAQAAALRNLSVGRQESYWDRLDELELPLLLVAGEHDSKYSEINRRMSERLRQAEVVTIPAAGHNSHFEQPQAFAETVAQFLTRIGHSGD